MDDEVSAVVVLGAGGHARVVVEAMGSGRVAGHLTPVRSPQSDRSLGEWLGDDEAIDALAAQHEFLVGIGFVDRDGAERRGRLLAALGVATLVTVIHPRATVSPSAIVSPGTFVGPGAVIGTGSRLGRANIVNSGAVVDHDCRLDDNVHVASGATLAAGVTVGAHTLVGVGASIRQGISVGSAVVIGAGAVVVDDVPDDVTVVGVPARRIGMRR